MLCTAGIHMSQSLCRAYCCCCRKLYVHSFRNTTLLLGLECAKTPGYTMTLHKSHFVCSSYAKKCCFWAWKLTCRNAYLQTFFEIGTQSAYTPAIQALLKLENDPQAPVGSDLVNGCTMSLLQCRTQCSQESYSLLHSQAWLSSLHKIATH